MIDRFAPLPSNLLSREMQILEMYLFQTSCGFSACFAVLAHLCPIESHNIIASIPELNDKFHLCISLVPSSPFSTIFQIGLESHQRNEIKTNKHFGFVKSLRP